MEQHSLTLLRVSFGARCASNLEDVILRIENGRKLTQWCLKFSLSCTDYVFPHWSRHFFWSHTRDDGVRLQEDGRVLRGCGNSQVGR